jgi:hypothetical protein
MLDVHQLAQNDVAIDDLFLGLAVLKRAKEQNVAALMVEQLGSAFLHPGLEFALISMLLITTNLDTISMWLAFLKLTVVKSTVRESGDPDSVRLSCLELSLIVITI